MRISGALLRRRISRSLATILFLSVIQSLVAPVFAPEFSASSARAANSNLIQTNLTLDANAIAGANDVTSSMTFGTVAPTHTNTGVGYYTFDGTLNKYAYAQRDFSDRANVSIFMWVYPTAAGVILSHSGQVDPFGGYRLSTIDYTSAGKFEVGLYNSGPVWTTSTLNTPLNNWYYVGLTYDGSTIRQYINGQANGSVAMANWTTSASDFFHVGSDQNGTCFGTCAGTASTAASFRFGELTIYRSTLSASDVTDNFTKTQSRFAPTFINPANTTTFDNRNVTFTTGTCTSTSGAACTYQWQRSIDTGTNWSDLSGATSSSYTLSQVQIASSGYQYRIKVTDPGTSSPTSSALLTYSTAATLTVNVQLGSETDTALTLSGTQYGWQSDTGTSGVLDIRDAITVEAWVYPTESTTSTQYSVVTKTESFQLFHIDGIWKYALAGASAWGSGVSTGIPVRLNEWHHIAFTRAASTNIVLFYLDGNLVFQGNANGAASGVLADTAFPFAVGAMVYAGPTPSFRFKGEIDQIAIFDLVRTQSDIQSDMQNYLDRTTAGLRMYYDFNEGSGSTLFNRMSTANSTSDLAIVGSVTWDDVKTVTSDANYRTITFPRTYLTANGGWKVPTGVSQVAAVVVAGGGGGNGETDQTGWMSGGGGAGGYRYLSTNVIADSTQTVKVGQGGRRGLDYSTQSLTISAPTNGGDSIFASVTSLGGGYGGGRSLSGVRGATGGSGGSGGGGGTYSGAGGAGTAGQGNDGGSSGAGCCAAGGGGGAGGIGGSKSGTYGGDAGNGVLNPLYIAGISAQYLAGGGAGGGSTINGSAGTLGGVAFKTTAPGNTGSGGGGGGGGATSYPGGFGGSGVIIIKFLISTSKPIYTGPFTDTTTAGLTYTFVVTGSAPAPLVRTYLWQASTDTGTNWSNISVGSGFTSASYTTPILETTTSGSRYQYRVIVTDSETFTSLTDTSTGVFLIINPRIVITGSYTIFKYGVTHTDTFTVQANTGTGVKIIKRTSTAKSNITWDTSTANIARITVNAALLAGTYYDTLTVTDEESATTTLPVTITVLKADTATITVASRIDTYTASSLSYTDSFTVTGLVAGDSLTGVAYGFSGTANDGTIFTLAARPAIAGTYQIIPSYTLANATSYESVTVVSGQLTINRKLRTTTIGTKPTTLKYGDTSTVVATASEGASDGSISFATSTGSLCTFSGSTLQAIEATGTCSYTASIGRGNNYDSATSISYTTSLALADTLTVTISAITPLTYTASQASVNPRISISGLKLTDTATATSATFSYNSSTQPTSFTTVKPTFVDTYTVRSETLTLTSGSLSRYQGVTYGTGVLRINRAQQSPLVIPQYVATFGQPYVAVIFGGSGTGIFSETVSAGTATGCTISGHTVTTTTQGTCILSATKAQDQNYETTTVSGEIYFLIWTTNPTPPTTGGGAVIAINSEVAIARNSNAAPSITSVGASGDLTYPVEIIGAGFTATAKSAMTIKFWRNQSVATSDFQVISDTRIITKQPAGATFGRVAVSNSIGTGVSVASFTPLIL